MSKLTHVDEFKVVSQDAPLRQVDTATLFVRHCFTSAVVSIGIDHHWHLAAKLLWLVEQCRDPKARQRFVTELPDAIAFALFNRVEPLDLGLGIAPPGKRPCGALAHGVVRLPPTTLLWTLAFRPMVCAP